MSAQTAADRWAEQDDQAVKMLNEHLHRIDVALSRIPSLNTHPGIVEYLTGNLKAARRSCKWWLENLRYMTGSEALGQMGKNGRGPKIDHLCDEVFARMEKADSEGRAA